MRLILAFFLWTTTLFSYEVLSCVDAMIDYTVFVDDVEGERGGSGPIDLEDFQRLTKDCDCITAGGSGTNTTKGLASLGLECAVIGRIGNDEASEKYLESIERFSITSRLSRYNAPTGRIACLVTPDGHRTMRGYIGALKDSFPFEVNPSAFRGIRLFHVEGYQIPNPPFLKKLITHAKNERALVSMDLGCWELVERFKEDLQELVEHHLDIVFCNDQEAKALTGLGPEDAAKFLAERCQIAVVTCGADGGFVSSSGETFQYAAHQVKTVDDTGAGDLFMAGFLAGLLRGLPLEVCADQGAALAAKIVQIEGAELPVCLACSR
jgi:sugar/nucleoside kinase (ribokinase family)